jgi:hypothetical protein
MTFMVVDHVPCLGPFIAAAFALSNPFPWLLRGNILEVAIPVLELYSLDPFWLRLAETCPSRLGRQTMDQIESLANKVPSLSGAR